MDSIIHFLFRPEPLPQGQLGLLAFCKKLNEGKKVKIGNVIFIKQ